MVLSRSELEPSFIHPHPENTLLGVGGAYKKARQQKIIKVKKKCPKDPAVLKILRRSKFTMRSKSTIAQ